MKEQLSSAFSMYIASSNHQFPNQTAYFHELFLQGSLRITKYESDVTDAGANMKAQKGKNIVLDEVCSDCTFACFSVQ